MPDRKDHRTWMKAFKKRWKEKLQQLEIWMISYRIDIECAMGERKGSGVLSDIATPQRLTTPFFSSFVSLALWLDAADAVEAVRLECSSCLSPWSSPRGHGRT
jgi:hypothetical protein